MAHRTRVVWSDDFTGYDFGPEHPMNPVRLALTASLCQQFGLFDDADVRVQGAGVADDESLHRVHRPEYVQAVRAASLDPGAADQGRGLGTEDDPAFVGMHESSARIFAGSVDAATQLMNGEVEHAVNFCGGMHHAMADRASGFCIYNDCAGAIAALLDQGAQRIVYVDLDVHHGDGTERLFWDDPRVLTISLHESGQVLFPGTGWPGEIGGDQAQGEAVNVALPPGTGDAGWLRAVQAIVPPLVRAAKPDVLVTQHGVDSHFLDPLSHLTVSVDAQRQAMVWMHELAHEVSGGRWLATGGGGYAVLDVVPRAWTHLVAIAAHRPIEVGTAVPAAWLDDVEARFGHRTPATMGDGRSAEFVPWENGPDPDDPLDRSVMATRRAVFPLFGLDIWFD